MMPRGAKSLATAVEPPRTSSIGLTSGRVELSAPLLWLVRTVQHGTTTRVGISFRGEGFFPYGTGKVQYCCTLCTLLYNSFRGKGRSSGSYPNGLNEHPTLPLSLVLVPRPNAVQ